MFLACAAKFVRVDLQSAKLQRPSAQNNGVYRRSFWALWRSRSPTEESFALQVWRMWATCPWRSAAKPAETQLPWCAGSEGAKVQNQAGLSEPNKCF